MAFWIYMAIMDLLIPITMILIGMRFQKKPPKYKNALTGYRTKRSMLSEATWEFAHIHLGKTWQKGGIISALVTVVLLLPVFGKETDTVGIVGGVLSGVQCVFMIVTIIPTELALKRTFDAKGRRVE